MLYHYPIALIPSCSHQFILGVGCFTCLSSLPTHLCHLNRHVTSAFPLTPLFCSDYLSSINTSRHVAGYWMINPMLPLFWLGQRSEMGTPSCELSQHRLLKHIGCLTQEHAGVYGKKGFWMEDLLNYIDR